jgi:hypothetical protein
LVHLFEKFSEDFDQKKKRARIWSKFLRESFWPFSPHFFQDQKRTNLNHQFIYSYTWHTLLKKKKSEDLVNILKRVFLTLFTALFPRLKKYQYKPSISVLLQLVHLFEKNKRGFWSKKISEDLVKTFKTKKKYQYKQSISVLLHLVHLFEKKERGFWSKKKNKRGFDQNS